MSTSPDGNGVILVGGYASSYLDSILELKADGQGWVGAWTTLSTKLQYARRFHIQPLNLPRFEISKCKHIQSSLSYQK